MRISEMKRKLCGVLTAFCMTLGCVSGMEVSAVQDLPYGDCNMNGIVDAADAQMLCAYLTGESDRKLSKYADFNQDGILNIVDLTLMKQKILNPNLPKTATMLVYQCGSDLETVAKEATSDMEEMIRAAHTENLNIVLETGGSKKWHNDYVAADGNYRVTITKSGISSEKISDKPKNMGDSDTLLEFIQAGIAAYPADRYALVIWDHGLGPIFGCCHDELSDDQLTIPELCKALDACDVHFDWLGFDCCLMGSAEVAYAMRNYADYMVASEDSESAYGWYYKNFLTNWGSNISMPTKELVTQIVDDMVTYSKRVIYKEDEGAILSAYDLSRAEELMNAVYLYMGDVAAIAKSDGIRKVMEAREKTREFGDGDYDLVDLYDMSLNLKTEHSTDIRAAMNHMVVHSASYNVENASGINLWFFRNFPEDYVYLDMTFLQFGLDTKYVNMMKTLAKSYIGIRGNTASSSHKRTDPWFP